MNLDLVVLVPDKDIEQALTGLFSRPEAIGIRPIERKTIIAHHQHDPGVFTTGQDLLVNYARDSRFALVVFDRAWSGAPETAEEAEIQLEKKLRTHWDERARVVCIDPEVEAWVWSDSQQVASALGWESLSALKEWLAGRGEWNAENAKPADPKSAFLAALRQRQMQTSSSIFRRLGESVSTRKCEDRAFLRMRSVLREWFPSLDR